MKTENELPEHFDVLKLKVHLGDNVAFAPPSSKRLTVGKVIKLTPHGATMEFKTNNGNINKCNRPKSSIIVVNEQLKISKEKYPEEWI